MNYKLGEHAPIIDDTCFVAPSADLIGQVTLKPNASVWFNCVLRADNEPIMVGENANIQDGSILHVDSGFPIVIGNDVTVGHKVMLHGCTIGEGTLIGMNAVVLNGANIGKQCLIGANTLVTENMEIPDGSMVLGSPAKIVKQLDEQTKTLLKMGAEHYVQNGLHYKAELEEV